MMVAGSIALKGANVLARRRDLGSAIDRVNWNVPPGCKARITLTDARRTGFEGKIIVAYRGDIAKVETCRHGHGAVDELRVVGAQDGRVCRIGVTGLPACG